MTATTVDRQSRAVWPPKIRTSSLWEFAVFLTVFLAVVTPLLFLVLGSFSQARLPAEFSLSRLGLANYIKVWGDPATYAVMSNTLWFALGSTAYGILIAAALAWLVERTNIPGKIWIYAGVPMTLAMPGMLQAMAWVLLASPRIGFINKGLMDVFGLSSPPFNIYTLPGMIFIEGLRMVPDGLSHAGAAVAQHGSVARGSGGHVGSAPVFGAAQGDARPDAAGTARRHHLPVHQRAGAIRGARHSRTAGQHLCVQHEDLRRAARHLFPARLWRSQCAGHALSLRGGRQHLCL